jgi:TusA-related sulfurtransferase
VYETYAGEVVEIVDAHGEQCPDPTHRTRTHVTNAERRVPKSGQ